MPERFVWPPRPPNTSPAGADAPRHELDGVRHADADAAAAPVTGGAGGAGSPRRGGALVEVEPARSRAGWRIGGWPAGEAWHHVEHTLLGLRRATLARRLDEARWTDEPLNRACACCGSGVGPGISAVGGCPACRGRRWPWDRIVRLGAYEPPLRGLIQDVKFTAFEALGLGVGRMLGAKLARAVTAETAVGPEGESARARVCRVAVVPVPTTWRRRLMRGIDHAGVIAHGAVLELRRAGLRARVTSVLARRERPSQLAVPPGGRAANVRGAMRPTRGCGVAAWVRERAGPGVLARMVGGDWGWVSQPGTLVVLVDDVTTTRATLREAGRALRTGLDRLERANDGGGADETAAKGAGKAEGGRGVIVWAAVVAVTEPRTASELGRGGG